MLDHQTLTRDLKHVRVLIIEQDPFVACDLALAIEELGADVVALSGTDRDALHLLAHEQIDVAVVDPTMEGADVPALVSALGMACIPSVIYSASEYLQTASEHVETPGFILVAAIGGALRLALTLGESVQLLL
jgi:DNA-binding NarL/FixJ family response regulator